MPCTGGASNASGPPKGFHLACAPNGLSKPVYVTSTYATGTFRLPVSLATGVSALRPVSLSALLACSCLRFLDVLLLLCAAALCGGSLYCAYAVVLDNVGPTLLYAAAGVSGAIFAATIIGLVSLCGETKPGVLLTVRLLAADGWLP